MYLRSIRVQRLTLLRDLRLDFTAPDGKTLRKWTVIIGRNGTAKTSLLQALALAAAGSLQVNTLAGRSIGHLRDRRSVDPMEIDATFDFTGEQTRPALHPLSKGKLPEPLALHSQVTLAKGETTIRATAAYAHAPRPERDPLDAAWRRGHSSASRSQGQAVVRA